MCSTESTQGGQTSPAQRRAKTLHLAFLGLDTSQGCVAPENMSGGGGRRRLSSSLNHLPVGLSPGCVGEQPVTSGTARCGNHGHQLPLQMDFIIRRRRNARSKPRLCISGRASVFQAFPLLFQKLMRLSSMRKYRDRGIG